jgi:2-polyprenyl-3-methyl-5-hydroxy-6-metoxy-1,4-benzoquinol methylase
LIEKDTYQDIRIKGETVWKGRRECESRWKSIKPFLERYKNHKTFKVLDFGANYGYFSWRIKEEFSHAEIDMVDSREMLKLIYNINQPEDMTIFENMDTDTLKEHAEKHRYDLILAMSILHHFDNYDEILSMFQTFLQVNLL